MHLLYFLTLTLPLSLALPAPSPSSNGDGDTSLTADQIKAIAPKSSSCANPPAKGECATSQQAADNIAKSFDTYKVTSRAEQAAVIALMAFESEEFRYSRNHFPGRPGQGTRNMQQADFNKKYAKSIKPLKSKVNQAGGDVNQILDLLLADKEYDFGSGAWFLTTQCDENVRKSLASGSEDGWNTYISKCVGTDPGARTEYWKKAVDALGVQQQ